MAQKDCKRSLLSAIWHRLKLALGNESDQAAAKSRMAYKIQFLERCWIEDCLVEKYRKQLERQWSEFSNQSRTDL